MRPPEASSPRSSPGRVVMESHASEEIRKGFRVTGRVQGVGFRWWGLRCAQQLGLRGTIRNCSDGSVEVQLTGPAPAVGRLHSLLREGPPGARVRRVEEIPPPDGALPDAFEIVA